ncbi:probable hexosyltransferase MUCI70 isoform X2 [Panicum virgatum]|uniref:probable hexosyltransferase MUCI70 isoform X2 n=1 Tax=Panicum virgatum TaxID=38727 RepID=UPI0019D5C2B9|nr:probable hexosyltransferase MUCI70 isoform X2 [Panicum virgatum]
MPSSSSLIQGISISVSDDEEDTGKVRVRVRRKRSRASASASARRRRLLFRTARLGVPLLLAALAVSLLLYESHRLTPSHSSTLSSPSFADFGHLSRAARAAGSPRKSCLKLLDPEKLQNLELPEIPETNTSIKEVVYRSSMHHIKDDISSHTESSRFNLFTGYQTLTEREESFKIKESMTVHCGFCNENRFQVSAVDREYMRYCKVVVATCAFGGGDDLHQPIGMTENSIRKVCYVAFWDEVTRVSQEEEGNKIGEDNMIGLWRIILVSDLPFSDQRLNGKIPKLISHRLFPMARYSIWVDSKSQFRRDPLGVLEALLWRSNSSLALSEHGARSSLYDEAKAIVKKHKATPEEVKVQLDQYRKDGIPDEKKFNGKKDAADEAIYELVAEPVPEPQAGEQQEGAVENTPEEVANPANLQGKPWSITPTLKLMQCVI